MRDRLIELIRDCCELTHCLGNNDLNICKNQCVRTDKLASHLLAEGVIVPKVNVGDKLYYISNVGKIVENKVDFVGAFAKGTCYTEDGKPLLTTFFPDYEANKNYYFTREEAEAALAEREGDV